LALVTDSAAWWITEYGIDGFRHDATKHIPTPFWKELTRKIRRIEKETGRQIYQVGETFGSRELIGSYVGHGLLDGQFDFNLYWDARSVFVLDNEPFTKLDQSLQESFTYYGSNHLMGNISGNHDMPRMISFAGGDLGFGEDAQEAGWNREIMVKDPVGYQKLLSLIAFNLTIPGVPVIYYGDEIGMPGAGDPDNRRPMQFVSLNDHQINLRANVSRLTAFRNKHLSLIYGEFRTIRTDEKIYLYSRNYFGETTWVIFNKDLKDRKIILEISDEQKKMEWESYSGNHLEWEGNQLIVNLPPLSFEIFCAGNPLGE
jgi:glycosidase